ncbi:MAG: hypothetical protein ABMB14_04415 [Myxococcota bacterium]
MGAPDGYDPGGGSDVGELDLELAAAVFVRHVVVDGLPSARWGDPAEAPDTERLVDANLVTPEGLPTAAWDGARDQALAHLPVELDQASKLALLTRVFERFVADGTVDRDEGSALFRAATALGVRPSELDAHLDTLTDHVGSIELDLPEAEP